MKAGSGGLLAQPVIMAYIPVTHGAQLDLGNGPNSPSRLALLRKPRDYNANWFLFFCFFNFKILKLNFILEFKKIISSYVP